MILLDLAAPNCAHSLIIFNLEKGLASRADKILKIENFRQVRRKVDNSWSNRLHGHYLFPFPALGCFVYVDLFHRTGCPALLPPNELGYYALPRVRVLTNYFSVNIFKKNRGKVRSIAFVFTYDQA